MAVATRHRPTRSGQSADCFHFGAASLPLHQLSFDKAIYAAYFLRKALAPCAKIRTHDAVPHPSFIFAHSYVC